MILRLRRRHFFRLLAAPLIVPLAPWRAIAAATATEETLLAVKMPGLGVNPVYRIRNGVVVGQVHVASDDWADWRGDVVEAFA